MAPTPTNNDGAATQHWQDWTKPVGYHVTLPCSKDQAGYRTFDAAFAIDRGDGTIQMKYMHTALRDQDAYHSR